MDMAEIPTLQESPAIDLDGDGTLSDLDVQGYADRQAAVIARQLSLTVGAIASPLEPSGSRALLLSGAGGLRTIRIESEFRTGLDAHAASNFRTIRFSNSAFADRLGWREIVVRPAPGITVFDTDAFGNSLSDELRAYPEDLLASPLDERSASFSVSAGPPPAGSSVLRTRDGAPVVATRDRLAELIAVPEVTAWVMLVGLFIAAGLGAIHALSPGHGKTVVGAYLVGSRGTIRHALFLGLTVTVTHTAGVFGLGLVTLFAARFVSPEQLYPILGVLSGAIVLAMGLTLLVKRLRAALCVSQPAHHDHRDHDGEPHSHGGQVHSHGGSTHSHLPPGADESPVTMRSLLALGISGGLLPCPSALVVLLSAIALHRVGYGLLLVVAFSVGLAGALTAVGLAFVLAGRLLGGSARLARFSRILPVASAAVIAALGAAICWTAMVDAGIDIGAAFAAVFSHGDEPSFVGIGAVGILGLGLVFGLKHATEADHVVAVSTIVSEHRQLHRAAMVGALWGVGHTISLVAVGLIVLTLKVAISDAVAGWLEFGVALMIIGLGAGAVLRGVRGRPSVHVHRHDHDGAAHVHIHFHEDGSAHGHGEVQHAVARLGFKPLVVGAVHGLAGSAALTLLVLSQIDSAWLGLLYLSIFGLGSIAGMLAMSGLIGLPFALSSGAMNRKHHALQIAAGVLSILFGCWYAVQSSASVVAALVFSGRHY
ncbi:MAG: hypothetical protein WBQ66_08670 [Blastocatellia bacterium]